MMTRAHRIYMPDLVRQVEPARRHLKQSKTPPRDCDPCVAEAVVLAKHHEDRRKLRRLKRVHRGVRCAEGCGTKYGKRRADHNIISSGDGIEGGWFCPTRDGSCLDLQKATGDHRCGMCLNPATRPLEDEAGETGVR